LAIVTFKPKPQKQPETTTKAAQATTSPLTNLKEITRGNITKKEVIFTFDGGGTVQSADQILNTLSKHHIKGTFFLTGKMIEANPDLVKRIAKEGHEIFNHTYDHPFLTKISNEQITSELINMEKILMKDINLSPKPYFRAPYGARDARVLEATALAGYQSVYWTVDAHDWMNPQKITADQVKTRILSSLAPGNIYLMHLGDSISGAILDDVFTSIESKGYKIVSLTQGI
jgi:peptidoglycan/xylan/chitin deacetylase (PgdA/CDA1 family)